MKKKTSLYWRDPYIYYYKKELYDSFFWQKMQRKNTRKLQLLVYIWTYLWKYLIEKTFIYLINFEDMKWIKRFFGNNKYLEVNKGIVGVINIFLITLYLKITFQYLNLEWMAKNIFHRLFIWKSFFFFQFQIMKDSSKILYYNYKNFMMF